MKNYILIVSLSLLSACQSGDSKANQQTPPKPECSKEERIPSQGCVIHDDNGEVMGKLPTDE